MSGIITIVTDFQEDYSSAQIEGVIRSITPETVVIRATDKVTPFNIREGSFVLWDLARFYPKETVHIAVVDPGVGTNRRILSVETDHGTFVGPDNGVFDLVAKRFGVKAAYAYPREQFNGASNTFHGRDIFSKIAAGLAQGNCPYERTKISYRSQKKANTTRKPSDYEILHIDGYGNLKLDKCCKDWFDQAWVRCHERNFSLKRVETFHQASQGDLVAYLGSSEVLELAVVEASAQRLLDVQVGDLLALEPVKR